MAVRIESVDLLKEYFQGVVTRANHHAPNIDRVIYSLLGVVILLKDDNTHIEVRGSQDAMANILWVRIDEQRFALRYEHEDGTIEIRRDSFNGEILLKIDNSTSIQQILDTFGN